MKDKPLFFAYARKSPTGFTPGQTEKNPIPSIDRQEADLAKMAAGFPKCGPPGRLQQGVSKGKWLVYCAVIRPTSVAGAGYPTTPFANTLGWGRGRNRRQSPR